MRSSSILRKSHLFIKHSTSSTVGDLPPLLQSRPSCSLGNRRLRPLVSGQAPTRFLSSGTTPVESNEESTVTSPPESAKEPDSQPGKATNPVMSVDEIEKIPSKVRRTRVASSSTSKETSKDTDPVEFPEGLESEILFVPTQSYLVSPSTGLPPIEIFEEALDHLMISLHPDNQARATNAPENSSRPIEPTLGLYCPIEGGDYVVDMTVHELAFQTGAEVLVLDAAQLAAGECGIFGEAADALDLRENPLHFTTPRPAQPPDTHERKTRMTQEEEDDWSMVMPSRMSISLPRALPALGGRMIVPHISRKPAGPSKLDLFFDALVNMPSHPESQPESTTNQRSRRSRPRLIYVRDFPTLASSSSSWYPALLNAVRQRRRNMASKTAAHAGSPVSIVFGMSPSIAYPSGDSSSGSRSNLMNLLMNQNSSPSQMASGAKTESVHDWTESETAEIAREKRLRSRIRKWEKNPAAFQDEYPKLDLQTEGSSKSSSPDIIVIGGPEGISAPSSSGSIGVAVGVSDADDNSQFFRSVVLVPRGRSVSEERASRVARRREINELTIRMGIAAVGGTIESKTGFADCDPPEEGTDSSSPTASPMWEDWGNRIERWSNVCKIADRAMGSVMLSEKTWTWSEKPVLTPTPVPWSAVQSAWVACNQLGPTRTVWMKEAFGDKVDESQSDAEDKSLNAPGSRSDKVVDSLKNDPDLDQHEARLLPCIVDANSMSTTFAQVHLPGRTIDAVRTIVSLPLLHPHAFQTGILKEHGMTGCLLFGPPGTGKTLVVRALAKEAGCRMLVISPSDVMDMYVGEGEKLVRAVFSLARKLSPCVVFLDEIDALFGARMSARESGSAFAHRGVLTEFMQELDGLKTSKEHNVIVIGATNRPFDLDDAVLRRLPRRLLVDLPGEKEREEIFKILLRDESLADDVNINALAKKTDGFSGSDLKHLCVSAALDSVKEHMELPWTSRHAPVVQSSVENVSTSSPASVSSEKAVQHEENVEDTASAVDLALEGAEKVDETPSASEQHPLPTGGEQQQLANTSESPLGEGQDTNASPETGAPPTPSTQEASSASATGPSITEGTSSTDAPHPPRILRLHHFTQALKEITPSSSEALGSLSDLRKWNEEFGEGRRDRKKHQVWGKGRFGFINALDHVLEDGRVAK